jgi:hypothetical protein
MNELHESPEGLQWWTANVPADCFKCGNEIRAGERVYFAGYDDSNSCVHFPARALGA